MSLQVWLPLNGDLRNQGLDSVTVTNSGATINTTGKIGSCYSFNGSSNYLSLDPIIKNGTQDLSFTCWVKFNALPAANAYYCLLCSRTSTAKTCVAIWLRGDGVFVIDIGARWTTAAQSIEVNKWYHIAVTSTSLKRALYINGIQVAINTSINTITSTVNTNNVLIGAQMSAASGVADGTYLNGLLNDVRIYDYCLSDKEIEEIAKGLVLHYKLDDPYTESTTLLSSTINETAYNASISKYGYNDTSNLIKTTGIFQGKQCIKVGTRVAGQTAKPYAYFSNLFTSDGTNAPAYKALSFDYYTTVPTTTWLNIYKLGNGSGTATWKTTNKDGVWSGTYTNSSNAIIVSPNQWNHIEVVLHGTTEANAEWGYCINGPEHTSSADYYFLYANIQLEQNDHITSYKNNELYHSLTVYDNSGYENNGTLNGALNISNNTNRYNYSTLFNGTTACIKVPYNTINPDNIFTLNLWFYKSALGSKNYETLFGGPSGFEMDTRANNSTTLSLYMASTRGGTIFTPFEFNTWYMVTMTRDGTNEKYYVNGELKKTIEAKSMPTGDYFIGAWKTATQQNYYGNISDFRLYNTVLTEAQILELYNTSASIDRSGNIYAREVNEP